MVIKEKTFSKCFFLDHKNAGFFFQVKEELGNFVIGKGNLEKDIPVKS